MTSAFFKIAAGCLLFVAWVLGAVADADRLPERFFMEADIPDLWQFDPQGEFEGGGKMYCAPVAVSNSLMGLFGDDLQWEGVTQYDVVRKLASVGYMNTHRRHGTHLNQMIRGVQRFVREQGVEEFWVKFQGFHRHERLLSAGTRYPSLNWIRGHLANGGAAWLMAGWYRYDPEAKEYHRDGYHWVSLVGFGEDAAGRHDPEILIVHDPSTRGGGSSAREYVRLTRLEEGMIIGAFEFEKIGARGAYRLGGGMHIKPGVDLALLEGAVVLAMKKDGLKGERGGE